MLLKNMAIYTNLICFIQVLSLLIMQKCLQIAIKLEKKHFLNCVLLGCNDEIIIISPLKQSL